MAVSRELSNTEIIYLFYRKTTDFSNVWICQCAKSRSIKISGLTNLIQNKQQKHPQELPAAKNEG